MRNTAGSTALPGATKSNAPPVSSARRRMMNRRTACGDSRARCASITTTMPSATARWLHTDIVPTARARGGHRRLGAVRQLADALERDARRRLLPDLQQLLEMTYPVTCRPRLALGSIAQADLHVLAHLAWRQIVQRGAFGQASEVG
ncbi:MAG: hypothetical protein JSR83_20235 [Proteobacteria bacterium]|nr:hypothetical protein [Pseudomonadota bacterium]